MNGSLFLIAFAVNILFWISFKITMDSISKAFFRAKLEYQHSLMTLLTKGDLDGQEGR